MRSSTNFSDPFAAVEVSPVSVAGQEVAKVGVRVKDDNGEYQLAGILSKDYNLITNSVARDIFSDVMSRTPYQFKELKTYWDGKRYIAYYHSIDPIAGFDNGGNHPLHLGIMGRNSYDGSSIFGFEIYALNPFCINQYHDRNRFGFFAIRHTAGDKDKWDFQDATENLSRGAQNVIAAAPHFKQLTGTPLEINHILDAKNHIEIPTSKWGSVLERLSTEPDSRKLFGLFQALTYVASHEISGLSSISVGTSIMQHLLPAPKKTD